MIYLSGLNAVSALGHTKEQVLASMQNPNFRALTSEVGYLPEGEKAVLGHVDVPTPKDELRNLTLLNCCLLELEPVLLALKAKVKPERIGIVIGTSTSALTDVELETKAKISKNAMTRDNSVKDRDGCSGLLEFDPRVYEIGIISEHVRNAIGALGPCYTVATACSSSARALLSARNLIRSGLCDAVVAGGADSLSRVTVSGFHALGAIDSEEARPFAKDRAGINIGEGAGLCVVAEEPFSDNPIKLLGGGGSTDAYHVSAPDPTAQGALIAVKAALADAGLLPSDISYINMHGTGTKLNDAMEGQLIREIFGDKVPVSSLKHLTGHTLGAAGIVEAAACAMILNDMAPLPYHPYKASDYKEEFGDLDLVVTPNRRPQGNIVMSNNFAFGGNNTSLIFGV